MKPALVLPVAYDIESDVLTPPTQDAPFPLTFHAHTHSSPNTRINLIKEDDDIEGDNEEKCKGKRNLDEGDRSPHVWIEESSVEETQNTHFWRVGCTEAQEGGPTS